MEFLLIAILWISSILLIIYLFKIDEEYSTNFTHPIALIAYVLIYTILCLFIDGIFFHKPIKQKEIVIIASATDHNLTSVIYINSKGDTVAQDYLTYKQLCNLH